MWKKYDNTCVLKANWKIIYGTITIEILDEQNNGLKDGKYILYDSSGKSIQTKESGKSSEVKFDNLPVGTYTICEKQIQEGYELIKTNAKVEITESNTNIILNLIHKKRLVLPETGGVSKDLEFILIGVILVLSIFIIRRRRNK